MTVMAAPRPPAEPSASPPGPDTASSRDPRARARGALFENLLASRPVDRRRAPASVIGTAIAIHIALVAVAVWVTFDVIRVRQNTSEQVTFIRIQQDGPAPAALPHHEA